jgi:hypothetical protein
MLREDLPEWLVRELKLELQPRDKLPIRDYHGLPVEGALVQFVSDYYDALRSPPESQQFRVVHGYGSTGRGGRIKTILREMLTFEMDIGTLTFRASEEIDRHPGYTIVTPISDLHAISVQIFSSPICARDNKRVIRRVNALIDCHHTKKSSVPEKLSALDPKALDALNHVFDSNSDENRGA